MAQLPYLTGATRIGLALQFGLDNELKASKGWRADIRDIVITITDGQSQDDPKPAAERIRETVRMGDTCIHV